MPDTATVALLSTAAVTSLLHTLIPDHWLPFVLVGRARGWSTPTVAFASGLSAVIHSSLSVLLGLGALWLGMTGFEAVGRSLEGASAILLLVFGLGYALWSWRKGGHFHPGGALVHRGLDEHACSGDEGPEHPEHLHFHADGELIASGGGRWGAMGLAVIVGLNPCILVLPVMLASVSHGAATIGLVALAYALPATLLMVGLSVFGVLVSWRIRLPGVARYAEAVSGLAIAALGVISLILEH